MSPKNPFLNVGLTALGWLGLAATHVAADDPGPVPPSGQATAAAPSPSLTVLSLSDGHVFHGKVQVDAAGYTVLQKGGVLRFRKEQVEGAFGSLQDVYRFKAERLPARDPDEHLKLAQWCLTQHLKAEAKAQLLAVLELSPGNARIQDMIANIDNALARQELRDEAVTRTRGERPIDDRPAELDPGVFRPGRAAPGPLGPPMIFDLPPSLAAKRADEFASRVHPVLQRTCVRCHNESYQGSFQLVQVKNRKEWTPNVARANLDATLNLIDPDNLPRSELLSRALVPHGPIRQPLFRGASDPVYQQVAAWVNSLRPRPSSQASATSSRFRPTEPEPPSSDAEGFATVRTRPSAPPTPAITAPPDPFTSLPRDRIVAAHPDTPPNAEFPAPYMLGGPKPKLEANPGAVAPSTNPTPGSSTNPAAALPPLPQTTGVPVPAAPATDANQAQSQAPPKSPRKPLKIDPALLERALSNRQGPQ